MSLVCVWEFGNLAIPRTRCRRPTRRCLRRRSTSDGPSGNAVPDNNFEKDTPQQNRISTYSTDSKDVLEETRKSQLNSVRYSGLRGNPLSCGVESATGNFELPAPPAAARNLVTPNCDSHTFDHTLGRASAFRTIVYCHVEQTPSSCWVQSHTFDVSHSFYLVTLSAHWWTL